ncbi:hypothetical protein SPF06_01375 [Sinomonas sp. JGH33]|uniref:DUF559 domain-containing protein n=1 Tax=Sinomonas terricola TaxID=3110330 RepID=A0ABU5T129_9MICC|nr:hypothetical protein [Sinomonas sp. JGH33]MEA5453361.1 hypothetical protein [Sinomonas sp. JGH33]
MGGPEQLLASLGGSAAASDMRRYFSQRQLERAVLGGGVVRPRNGVYALASLDEAHRVALECRGVLFARSAALAHGLGVLERPRAVDVAVRRGTKIRAHPQANIVTRLLPEEDLVRVGVVTATSPVRTVLDCAAQLEFAEGLAVADSALRCGLVTGSQLTSAAEAWIGRNKRALRRVLAHMDGRAANPFESGLRAACLEAGVALEPQLRISTRGGTFVVDLGSALYRVTAEADSFEWHGGREALHRDCTRYNELVRDQWTVLRFSWEHVMFDRAWVGQVVADVIRGSKRHNSRGRNAKTVHSAA